MNTTLKFLGILVAIACVDCTPAQVAQAGTDTSQAIDLTDAVCSLAPDSPVGQPYVDVVCALAEGGEQLVSIVIGAIAAGESDGGAASMGAATTSTMIRVPVRQIRVSIPNTVSAKFLASHAKKK